MHQRWVGRARVRVGTSELALVLATQSLVQRRPKMMRVTFTGASATTASPKDLMLDTIARLGADAGAGYAIEFAGPPIVSLGVEQRMTVCNLAVELGREDRPRGSRRRHVRLRGLPPLRPAGRAAGRAVEHWRGLASDADAVFEPRGESSGTAVAPQITWGTSPAHSIPVDGRVPDPATRRTSGTDASGQQAMEYMGVRPGQQLEGLPIQWVFIGSCTNGRLSDLGPRPPVARGARVAPTVRALVVPGSDAVRRAAEAKGLDRVFYGRRIRVGRGGMRTLSRARRRRPGAGDRCVSTSNRNFMGRQGIGVRTHLAGAGHRGLLPLSTAAIADVRGKLA